MYNPFTPTKSEQISLYEPIEHDPKQSLFLDYHLNSSMIAQKAALEFVANEDADYRKQRMEHWRQRARSVFSELAPQSMLAPVEVIPVEGGERRTERPFEEILQGRRTMRQGRPAPMSVADLGYILHNSLRVTHRGTTKNGDQQNVEMAFRIVPSGGALFPVKAYLIPLNVPELPLDVYHVSVEEMALQRLGRALTPEAVAPMFLHDENVLSASVLFILTGCFYRSAWKYNERSYRFVLLEAGAILHQIGLASEAIGWNNLMIGGFYDNLINELIDCNGVEESALICGATGLSGPGALLSNAQR